MKEKKLELINEQTSPLFRIMWVQNFNEPQRRNFENNICAFHIGGGYILSVAHNIRTESQVLKVIENHVYQKEILPFLNQVQAQLFNRCYQLEPMTNKRYVKYDDKGDFARLTELFQQIKLDTRWLTLMQKGLSKPQLIVQFREPSFYGDPVLNSHFAQHTFFTEPGLNRHTFILEVELTEAFYSDDIALYKIVNTHQDIIDKLPVVEPDFSLLDDTEQNLYCLQSSPGGFLGRLLNNAKIEGILDTWGTFNDRIGGNYIFDGNRYLIKGYFRFGSSGAPYVYYNQEENKFKVNAIQSEASPIQLSINNNREGNYQYINAIASPLNNIEYKLKKYFST